MTIKRNNHIKLILHERETYLLKNPILADNMLQTVIKTCPWYCDSTVDVFQELFFIFPLFSLTKPVEVIKIKFNRKSQNSESVVGKKDSVWPACSAQRRLTNN